MPGDAQYASETAYVESAKVPLLSYVKSPGLAAVQQRAQNPGSVDLDIGTFRHLLFDRTLLVKLQMVAFADAPVKLRIQKKSIRDRLAKLYEVMDNIWFMLQDCNIGR